MKRAIAAASAMATLAIIGTVSSPDMAAAREASVCQFYKGAPLCKTVEHKNCINVGVGETCTTTTEYWYWS